MQQAPRGVAGQAVAMDETVAAYTLSELCKIVMTSSSKDKLVYSKLPFLFIVAKLNLQR